MKDKIFLEWIRDRLIKVHGEHKNMDYMIKLKAIADATDRDIDTPAILEFNTYSDHSNKVLSNE